MVSFECELTERQRFYLYISGILPNLELIQELWKRYKADQDIERLHYHNTISPFRPHPAGDSSLIQSVVGVDHDAGRVMAHMVPKKGFDKYAVGCMVRDVEHSGYDGLIIKGDQENRIMTIASKMTLRQDDASPRAVEPPTTSVPDVSKPPRTDLCKLQK